MFCYMHLWCRCVCNANVIYFYFLQGRKSIISYKTNQINIKYVLYTCICGVDVVSITQMHDMVYLKPTR